MSKEPLKLAITLMKTYQHLATLIAGTLSILSWQLFGFLSTPQSHGFRHSSNLAFLASRLANLPAQAESNSLVSKAPSSSKQYFPPLRPNPRRTQGSGSRGCDQSLAGDLVTLLIPSKDYAGQTTSGHPTFFWYLSQPVSVPMRFSLVEPGVARPLYEKQIDSPQVGMIQVALPKDKPELLTGRQYKWSVTLLCNTKRPSANPLLISWIERIPTTAALEQQLAAVALNNHSSTQTLRDRAWIYARWGLWYNALATISKAQATNPRDLAIQDDFLSLLEQVGLNQVTAQERQSVAKH